MTETSPSPPLPVEAGPIPSEGPVSGIDVRRRVEFADTDLGGIVHFSRFFVFMETAEHELLRALGTLVHTRHQGHAIGWPRVEAHCKYMSPLRYGDEVEIRLRVARKGHSSMTYEATFWVGERRVAEGRISSVCCVLDDPAGIRPVAIPQPLADRLAEAL
ncbi:MAG: thioesterase family protein [Acidobacteriota bacterium]